MATEKEIKVLKKIYDLSVVNNGSTYNSIHYSKLVDSIFSEEIIKRYNSLKLQKMTCTYLGKMARKDLIQAEYKTVGNYVYFEGYYLRENGIKILNNLN